MIWNSTNAIISTASLSMHTFRNGFLLPNEPSLINSGKDKKLSQRFLTPFLVQIETFLLLLREDVDARLKEDKSLVSGKPYPLGKCLEISLAMQSEFKRISQMKLRGECELGRLALQIFLRNGGSIRQIWGDLRGNYFQNAFQIGTYYVDVANDTVTPTKPKVEILPFTEAGITAIQDYEHYSRIAQRYWGAKTFPNHWFPEVAPFAALIVVMPDGRVRVRASSNYMLSLVVREQFTISESILEQDPADLNLFTSRLPLLADRLPQIAPSAIEGRSRALERCRQYRDELVKQSPAEMKSLMRQMSNKIEVLNHQLSQIHFVGGLDQNPACSVAQLLDTINRDQKTLRESREMKKIQIDQNHYDLEQFSPEAKTQLDLLIASENKITELRRELTMIHAARNSFLAALKPLLPPSLE